MKFEIKGQISGGKNNMGVTASGRHYPKKGFSKWRLEAEWQLKAQLKKMKDFEMIDQPVNMTLNYTAGDLRRRDATAVLDAVFHVLERMGIVKDDSLIGGAGRYIVFNHEYDKKNPKVEIIFE